MLRFLTAGESHGHALVTILEGIPAGLPIDFDALTAELRRRQGGYGRGRRMVIESDRAQALSGVRHGVTTGAPIALMIPNKDWENWQRTMAVEQPPTAETPGVDRAAVTRPRPGHADLAGVVKYGHTDIRNVLERASARETAARVAVGAIARQFLEQLGIAIVSHVASIGSASIGDPLAVTFEDVQQIPGDSPLHCVSLEVERQMIAVIDAARDAGDTMGGSFEVIARGVPVGLGSHIQWDRKLDGRLAQALMSIPAIKAVGIGRGPGVADLPGSRIHDEILPLAGPTAHPEVPVSRPTNNAGGLEGGHHQRRGPAGLGVHETDRHADEAAPLGGSDDDGDQPGRHRAQRRLRGPRRRGRRRSDGRDRPGRRGPREVRRRLVDRGRREHPQLPRPDGSAVRARLIPQPR